jgi:hypothetical protein
MDVADQQQEEHPVSINIRGALPKGDLNGLPVVEQRARTHKDGEVVLIIRASTRKITDNVGNEDDPWTVTLGVNQIEVVTGSDADFVGSLMNTTYEARTGRTPLPFGHDVSGLP